MVFVIVVQCVFWEIWTEFLCNIIYIHFRIKYFARASI